MAETTTKELTLTRVFDAPRELVWKAWTDAEMLKKWWGPHGFTNPVCEVDPRVGGKINIEMEDSEGLIAKGSRYPMTGEFTELEEPEKIVYTSAAIMNDEVLFDNLVTVTFEEDNGKTKQTVHVVVTNIRDAEKAAGPLSGMEMGWSQSLEKLADSLA